MEQHILEFPEKRNTQILENVFPGISIAFDFPPPNSRSNGLNFGN